jgi:hypothetical protein
VHVLLLARTYPLSPRIGAAAFGAVIGWNAYFVNRYRQSVVIGDLAAVVAAVGGGAILKLFPATAGTFGYYGFGLALGFFAYFAALAAMAWRAPGIGLYWLVTGYPGKDDYVPQAPGGSSNPQQGQDQQGQQGQQHAADDRPPFGRPFSFTFRKPPFGPM